MDMSEYKGEFVNEAREHLEILNQSLLDLEHDKSNMDLLNNIFRAAHTLKGSSATMGYTSVNTLTHRMENVLDAIRNIEITATSEAMDALFDCFDTLEIMIDAIDVDENSDIDVTELASRLESLLSESAGKEPGGVAEASVPVVSGTAEQVALPAEPAEPTESADPAPQTEPSGMEFTEEERIAAADAAGRGLSAFKLTIILEETCALKSVRAMMILKAISEHAEVLATTPGAEGIEDGKFDRGFDVVIGTSEAVSAVSESVEHVNEVERVGVLPLESEPQPGATVVAETAERPDEPVAADEPGAATSGMSATSSTSATTLETPAATPSAPAQATQPTTPAKKPDVVRSVQSVRVNIEKLDSLVNMVGELVINKIRLLQIQSTHQIKELDETVSNIDRLTNDLRDEVMQMRMVAVDQVFNRFPRMVRDLAKKKEKEIDLVVVGKEIELDRTVLDEVGEPLVHLLRNCVDHGIESPAVRESAGKPRTGTITLIARREKNHVVIEIIDDGSNVASLHRAPTRDVPLVGRIAAGSPILAEEDIQEIYPLPTELVGNEPVFMLDVRGDSMVDAGIFDGDYVVVRRQQTANNGQIVAALVGEDEATVKRLKRKDGRVILEAENPAYAPMVFTEGVEILGIVVAVLRRVE